MTRKYLQYLLVAVALAAAPLAHADEGHDHGDAAPAAGGAASPRIQAHSDLFELVGVVDGGQMTVYLDRYATNEPVTGASIEFESGTNKGKAQPQADGTYLIRFDALARPGDLPFSFTVVAGADTDLLAGDLHLPDNHGHEAGEARSPWPRRIGYVGALLAALWLAALIARKLLAIRRTRPNA